MAVTYDFNEDAELRCSGDALVISDPAMGRLGNLILYVMSSKTNQEQCSIVLGEGEELRAADLPRIVTMPEFAAWKAAGS